MACYSRLPSIQRILAFCLALLAGSGFIVGTYCSADEADIPKSEMQVGIAPGKGYTYLGTITPRHARDIESSSWSIGAETMDRDFTVYKNWREYLGPLGIKKARIQSGWAKTEESAGRYGWHWLDEIVFDMVDQGVEPWICLCYGNPIYPGGGDVGLGGGIIKSEEAFQAWERYVGEVVRRYGQHVDEWELWNEPRTGRGKGTAEYGRFVVRTARAVRAVQPKATIIIAAGGSFDTVFAKETLTWLRDQGKLGLVDLVTYHPYTANPDDAYGRVGELRRVIAAIDARIGVIQGENGCPSAPGGFGALGSLPWTERAQAKWALRRLLGDLGRGIPSSYFAICDMQYPDRINYKGLLKTNPDKTVAYRKPSYFAVQNLAAVFDDSLIRKRDFDADIKSSEKASRFSIFGYRKTDAGFVIALWRSDSIPGRRSQLEYVDVALPDTEFREPVWVDLIFGRAFAVADGLWRQDGRDAVFRQVPVYDSVVLLAERAAVGSLRRGSSDAR